VNFVAHAAVAARHDDDPLFVLGAALPDLLPLIGVRIERDALPASVRNGWMAHHAADAAFHEHPEFVRGASLLRVELRDTELTTGPRRAAAHVGWELLLDEAVMSDEKAVAAFGSAVRAGRDLLDDPRWHGLVERIGGLRPAPPQTPDVIADRVHRACGRRARLAFDISLVPQLASVLAMHQPHVNAVASRVLDEVSESSAPSSSP
jgi:hypothetical protein